MFKIKVLILSFIMDLFFGMAQGKDAEYHIVDQNDVPDILDMLATVTQTNFEKIETWEGRIINETMFTIRGEKASELLKEHTNAELNTSLMEIQRLDISKIEFKINNKKDSLFAAVDYIEPPAYLNQKDNRKYPSHWIPDEFIQIITSDAQVRIGPLTKTKNREIIKRLARKEQRTTNSNMIDPRKVFFAGGEPLWLTLSKLAQSLRIPDIEKFNIVIKEKNEDDRIIYRIEISMPGATIPFSIFVLSSEAGFNRIYAENRYDIDGSLMSKITTEYIKHQDIFLPKKWEMQQYYPSSGELMRYEKWLIEETQVNESIPDQTFMEFNYLNDDDAYNDEIKNKNYTVKSGKLVEKEK